jgi:hypothetical protein
MENFPGGADLELPTKLSPLLNEPTLSPSAPVRISRSVLSVFSSQESEAEILRRTDFSVPQYYYRSLLPGENNLKLRGSQISRFSIDSLFCAFYKLPGDVLQAVAAVELHNRGWRYHPELKLWFRKAESVQNLYFDPITWSELVFSEPVDQSKFLSSTDHAPRFGSNLGVLQTGPPKSRLPPGSPPSAPSALTRWCRMGIAE